jgi:hypothetical protein
MNAAMSECKRNNLCIDCDNSKCWLAGKALSDCPKYYCDRPKEPIDQTEDCEHCAFLEQYQKDMREYYKQKGSIANDME